MNYSLITGASAGIGKALARKLASKGHNLILVARSQDKLKRLGTELEKAHGISAVVLAADLCSEADALYEQSKKYDITLWVNNAGLGNFSSVPSTKPTIAKQMLALNVAAVTQLSIRYAADYRDKDAQLLNVSAVAGYTLLKGAVTYSATKFYVSAFTEGLAVNLRSLGARLRAKVLIPGPTKSEFVIRAQKDAAMDIPIDFSKFSFISAKQLAERTWEFLESDKIVGIVRADKTEFRDPVFPQF